MISMVSENRTQKLLHVKVEILGLDVSGVDYGDMVENFFIQYQ